MKYKIEEINDYLIEQESRHMKNQVPPKSFGIVRDLLAELEEAKREADSLAMFLWKKYYKDDAPDFSLCDSPAGVMTQIDNMVTGIPQKERKAAFLEAAEIAKEYQITLCKSEVDDSRDAVAWNIEDDLRRKAEE